jgi:DNA-binding HxlR family transcriptional regulator
MPLKMRKNTSPTPPARCAVGECMAILGGTWTPNVIWYLSGGPRRFSELKADMPPISAKMLSTRLKDLEEMGVLSRTVVATSPPSVEYNLTALGHEFVPIIHKIVEVGERLKLRQAGVQTTGTVIENRNPVAELAAEL